MKDYISNKLFFFKTKNCLCNALCALKNVLIFTYNMLVLWSVSFESCFNRYRIILKRGYQ